MLRKREKNEFAYIFMNSYTVVFFLPMEQWKYNVNKLVLFKKLIVNGQLHISINYYETWQIIESPPKCVRYIYFSWFFSFMNMIIYFVYNLLIGLIQKDIQLGWTR